MKVCPVSLPPLIPWPGGKRRMARKLIAMMPPHQTYVEPFAGGASVFWAKPLAKKSVLGDADRWVMGLYSDVRKGALGRCDGGIKVSKSLFARSSKKSSACFKVARASLSYHGDRATFGVPKKVGKIILATKLGKGHCYAQKLKRAKLRTGDFATTMRLNDSVNTVHFLDPPWPMKYSDKYHADGGPRAGKSRDRRSFGGAMDPRKVKKVADSMKGTVIVIYNWTPKLAALFRGKGWTVKKVAATTNRGDGGLERRPNLVAIKKARRR